MTKKRVGKSKAKNKVIQSEFKTNEEEAGRQTKEEKTVKTSLEEGSLNQKCNTEKILEDHKENVQSDIETKDDEGLTKAVQEENKSTENSTNKIQSDVVKPGDKCDIQSAEVPENVQTEEIVNQAVNKASGIKIDNEKKDDIEEPDTEKEKEDNKTQDIEYNVPLIENSEGRAVGDETQPDNLQADIENNGDKEQATEEQAENKGTTTSKNTKIQRDAETRDDECDVQGAEVSKNIQVKTPLEEGSLNQKCNTEKILEDHKENVQSDIETKDDEGLTKAEQEENKSTENSTNKIQSDVVKPGDKCDIQSAEVPENVQTEEIVNQAVNKASGIKIDNEKKDDIEEPDTEKEKEDNKTQDIEYNVPLIENSEGRAVGDETQPENLQADIENNGDKEQATEEQAENKGTTTSTNTKIQRDAETRDDECDVQGAEVSKNIQVKTPIEEGSLNQKCNTEKILEDHKENVQSDIETKDDEGLTKAEQEENKSTENSTNKIQSDVVKPGDKCDIQSAEVPENVQTEEIVNQAVNKASGIKIDNEKKDDIEKPDTEKEKEDNKTQDIEYNVPLIEDSEGRAVGDETQPENLQADIENNGDKEQATEEQAENKGTTTSKNTKIQRDAETRDDECDVQGAEVSKNIQVKTPLEEGSLNQKCNTKKILEDHKENVQSDIETKDDEGLTKAEQEENKSTENSINKIQRDVVTPGDKCDIQSAEVPENVQIEEIVNQAATTASSLKIDNKEDDDIAKLITAKEKEDNKLQDIECNVPLIKDSEGRTVGDGAQPENLQANIENKGDKEQATEEQEENKSTETITNTEIQREVETRDDEVDVQGAEVAKNTQVVEIIKNQANPVSNTIQNNLPSDEKNNKTIEVSVKSDLKQKMNIEVSETIESVGTNKTNSEIVDSLKPRNVHEETTPKLQGHIRKRSSNVEITDLAGNIPDVATTEEHEKTSTNTVHNNVDDVGDTEIKLNKQSAVTKIIESEDTSANPGLSHKLLYETILKSLSKISPHPDEKISGYKKTQKDHIIEHHIDILKPLLMEALLNSSPRVPQNSRGIDDVSVPLVENSDNMEQSNEELEKNPSENREEPNDKIETTTLEKSAEPPLEERSLNKKKSMGKSLADNKENVQSDIETKDYEGLTKAEQEENKSTENSTNKIQSDVVKPGDKCDIQSAEVPENVQIEEIVNQATNKASGLKIDNVNIDDIEKPDTEKGKEDNKTQDLERNVSLIESSEGRAVEDGTQSIKEDMTNSTISSKPEYAEEQEGTKLASEASKDSKDNISPVYHDDTKACARVTVQADIENKCDQEQATEEQAENKGTETTTNTVIQRDVETRDDECDVQGAEVSNNIQVVKIKKDQANPESNIIQNDLPFGEKNNKTIEMALYVEVATMNIEISKTKETIGTNENDSKIVDTLEPHNVYEETTPKLQEHMRKHSSNVEITDLSPNMLDVATTEEYEKISTDTVQNNVDDNDVNDVGDMEIKLNKQPAVTKIIESEDTNANSELNNKLVCETIPKILSIISPHSYQKSSKNHSIEYLIDVLNNLHIDLLRNSSPRVPQNSNTIDEVSVPLVEDTNNIEQSNEELEKKPNGKREEPNDKIETTTLETSIKEYMTISTISSNFGHAEEQERTKLASGTNKDSKDNISAEYRVDSDAYGHVVAIERNQTNPESNTIQNDLPSNEKNNKTSEVSVKSDLKQKMNIEVSKIIETVGTNETNSEIVNTLKPCIGTENTENKKVSNVSHAKPVTEAVNTDNDFIDNKDNLGLDIQIKDELEDKVIKEESGHKETTPQLQGYLRKRSSDVEITDLSGNILDGATTEELDIKSTNSVQNNIDDNNVDDVGDMEIKLIPQPPVTKIIKPEDTNANPELHIKLDYETILNILNTTSPHPDEKISDYQKPSKDQIVKHFKDFLKPLITEVLQNSLPRVPQNTNGIDTVSVPLVADSDDIEQSNEELEKRPNENREEPNDKIQTESLETPIKTLLEKGSLNQKIDMEKSLEDNKENVQSDFENKGNQEQVIEEKPENNGTVVSTNTEIQKDTEARDDECDIQGAEVFKNIQEINIEVSKTIDTIGTNETNSDIVNTLKPRNVHEETTPKLQEHIRKRSSNVEMTDLSGDILDVATSEEIEKKLTKSVQNNIDDNNVDDVEDMEIKLIKQSPVSKIIEPENTSAKPELNIKLVYETILEIFSTSPDPDEKISDDQKPSKDHIVKHFKEFLKPLIMETFDNSSPRIPQNSNGIDEASVPLVEELDNIEQSNEEHEKSQNENMEEPNDKIETITLETPLTIESDEDIQNKDQTKAIVEDDMTMTDTNLTLQDNVIPKDQVDSKETKLEEATLVAVAPNEENSTSINDYSNEVNKERDVETELNKQQDQPMTEVIGHDEIANVNSKLQLNSDHVTIPELITTVLSQQMPTDNCHQNVSMDHSIEYLRSIFRPLVIEALQNVIQTNRIEKELLRPVIAEPIHIKESNNSIENEKETNSEIQHGREGNAKAQTVSEPNIQLQSDKETIHLVENEATPKDQLQDKQEPIHELQIENKSKHEIPNEKETCNQLKSEKELHDQLQKEKEPKDKKVPSDRIQNEEDTKHQFPDEKETCNQLKSEKELHDQLQKEKEPKDKKVPSDRIQNEEDTKHQFPDEKETCNQLKSEKELHDQLQKEKEPKDKKVPSDRIQNEEDTKHQLPDEKETCNQLKSEIELHDRLQKEKEPKDKTVLRDRIQSQEDTKHQFPDEKESYYPVKNEKKANNQLQTEKESIDHLKNKKVSSNKLQNEKDINDSLQNDKESNNQFQNNKESNEQQQKEKEPNDDLESKEIHPIKLDTPSFESTRIEEQVEEDEARLVMDLTESFRGMQMSTDNCLQNSPMNQSFEYLRTIFSPHVIEALQDVIPTYRFEKELLQPATEETINIRELNKSIEKEKESKSEIQHGREENDRAQIVSESNIQLHSRKETIHPDENETKPKDQLQTENKFKDELPDENETYNQLKSEKQLNDQLQKEKKTKDNVKDKKVSRDRIENEKDTKDQLQTEKEPKNQFKNEKDINDRLQNDEESNNQFQNNKETNEQQQNEKEPNDDLESEEIRPIKLDTPDFESTRIEEEVNEDRLLMDLTESLRELVIEKRNADEVGLKEEEKINDQTVDANENIVETPESSGLARPFDTTDVAEIKPLQEPLRFHDVHGDNIRLSKNNSRAQRMKKSNFFSKGIAFSSRPIAIGEKVSIHLKQLSSYWLGLITIGFTTNDPMSIANNLPTNVIIERNCADGFWAEHLDKKYYQASCRLHYYLNSSGNMCFGVNGIDKIEFLWNLDTTAPVWALIDIFGYFTIVELDVPKEIRNTSSVDSSLISNRNKSWNSFIPSMNDNDINKSCLNYQIRFVPLDLYTQFKGSCMTFLEERGVCITSGAKSGYIEAKFPLFPGQTIVVQNLSAGKALFFIGVKYGSSTTEASDILPESIQTNVMMHVKDELAITFTEVGEIRVTKNLHVPKTIHKGKRSQEFWAFVKIFKRNQMIKIWSNNTSSLAAFQT